MSSANSELKKYAKSKGVFLWEIGERMGYVYDSAFARKLRHELTDEEKFIFRGIVDDISREKEKEA